MTAMPEMKTAQDQMKKFKNHTIKIIKIRTWNIKQNLQKYEQESATAGDALNETFVQKENARYKCSYPTISTNCSKELGKKKWIYTNLLWKKAQKAIQKSS